MGVKSREKKEAGAEQNAKIGLHNLSSAPGSTKNRKRLGRTAARMPNESTRH